MKCPKCGYNSFEYLNSCKKCGAEFSSFKRNMGISPIIFKTSATAVNAGAEETIVDLTEEYDLHVVPAETATNGDDNFTWDTPMENTSVEPDQSFADFNLDAVKEELPLETSSETFSFNEQPEVPTLAAQEEKSAPSLEEFSFYEETIDLEEKPDFTEQGSQLNESEDLDALQASGNDLFGETGIIGELLPEQLQQDIVHDDADSASAEYEHEFNLESIFGAEEEKPDSKEQAPKSESYDFADFEKEFELIFNDEDSTTGSEKK